MTQKIAPAKGKLGILMPGIGAVSTTFMAGVMAVRKGLGQPVGSLTQLGTIRLGKRTDNRTPTIKEFVPLAGIDQLVFGGWDIFEDNAYEAAANAAVLKPELLKKVKPQFRRSSHEGRFDKKYVRLIDGPNVKTKGTLLDKAHSLMDDIKTFKKANGCDRLIMIWTGSTEVFHKPAKVHQTIESFEKGLAKNDPDIAPSQVYAYAALMCGVPFANGAPNLTHDVPALLGLARDRNLPVCGKDFKTGQTFLKTLIAPGLKAKCWTCKRLVLHKILGNRDGEVRMTQALSRARKSRSYACSINPAAESVPATLHGSYQAVSIKFYPPRGYAKVGWGPTTTLRRARLSDADKDRLPVPRFDSGRAAGARSGVVPRSGATRGDEGHPGVVELLFQGSDDGARSVPRTRHLHPTDETEKHSALDAWRGPHHSPRPEYYVDL